MDSRNTNSSNSSNSSASSASLTPSAPAPNPFPSFSTNYNLTSHATLPTPTDGSAANTYHASIWWAPLPYRVNLN